MKRHQSAFKLQATNPRKLQSNVSQFHTKTYLAKISEKWRLTFPDEKCSQVLF